MYEELSIERLKIELSMFKSINMFNTIDEANIYIMEQPSEIQKIFPGIMNLIKLLENLYLGESPRLPTPSRISVTIRYIKK